MVDVQQDEREVSVWQAQVQLNVAVEYVDESAEVAESVIETVNGEAEVPKGSDEREFSVTTGD
jgi:hypothetical protein